jgi:hypothetical protein
MNGWRCPLFPLLALATALGPGCDRPADLEARLETERRQYAESLRVRDDQIAQFDEVIGKLTADVNALRKEVETLRQEKGGVAAPAEGKPESGAGRSPAAVQARVLSADGAGTRDAAIQAQRAALALLLAENVELRNRLAAARAGAAPGDPLPDPLPFPLPSVEDELARIHHALIVLQDRMQMLERP